MAVFVMQVGEWGEARTRFRGLAFRLQQAAEAAMKADSEAMARRIQNNLYAQNYPHQPLAESTVERKEREGADDRTLIEFGDYVKGIESIKLGRFQWAVGVRDGKLAEIGTVHEWGGHTPTGAVIPARPVYRVEIERMKTDGRLTSIASAFAKVLAGER